MSVVLCFFTIYGSIIEQYSRMKLRFDIYHSTFIKFDEFFL
jgi:hypothetical protein